MSTGMGMAGRRGSSSPSLSALSKLAERDVLIEDQDGDDDETVDHATMESDEDLACTRAACFDVGCVHPHLYASSGTQICIKTQM